MMISGNSLAQADLDRAGLIQIRVTGSILLLSINIYLTFFGYKHFDTALLVHAATIGGFIGWWLGVAFTSTLSVSLNLGVALCVGLFSAMLTCISNRLMKFALGAILGLQLGTMLNIFVFHHIDISINRSDPNALGYIVMAILAIALGYAATSAGRLYGHIVVGAWVSAFWVSLAIGFIVGDMPPLFFQHSTSTSSTSSVSLYICVGVWIALGFAGTFVQMRLALNDLNFQASRHAAEEIAIAKQVALTTAAAKAKRGPNSHVLDMLDDKNVYVQETS
ncbi:unnamed protein product [Aphanomyces euteiches]